ncbi:hypothetical protein [Methylopila sp. M107]|nr:hypothetical protein [Methylopila sp. M107]
MVRLRAAAHAIVIMLAAIDADELDRPASVETPDRLASRSGLISGARRII